jgi:hypothetical protein
MAGNGMYFVASSRVHRRSSTFDAWSLVDARHLRRAGLASVMFFFRASNTSRPVPRLHGAGDDG